MAFSGAESAGPGRSQALVEVEAHRVIAAFDLAGKGTQVHFEVVHLEWAAQRVLDIKSDSFFETEEVTDGEKKKSRISVKVKANRLIGSFKPAGRQFTDPEGDAEDAKNRSKRLVAQEASAEAKAKERKEKP